MITREKHTATGSFLSLKINKAELFIEVQKRSALFAKNKKAENGDVDYDKLVITEDETLNFDIAFQNLVTSLAENFKANGLDRNDLVPIYNRDIYLYQSINDTEKNGVIEGTDPDAVFILIDNGRVGQNTISLLDKQLWEFATHYILESIYFDLALEFAELFNLKTKSDRKKFLSTLFYLL